MAEYVFTFDVIAADSDGYYIDRWDRSSRYEVIGATKAAALEALWPIVGTAPAGRFWKARQVGAAIDVRLTALVEDTKRAALAEIERDTSVLMYSDPLAASVAQRFRAIIRKALA